MSRVVAILSLCLALSACGAPRRSEPLAGPAPLHTASLEHGRLVFDQHCRRCHGPGEGGLGPSMNDIPAPKPLMRLQIRRGLGAMPGFSEQEISDTELDHLLDYIVALRNQPVEQASR